MARRENTSPISLGVTYPRYEAWCARYECSRRMRGKGGTRRNDYGSGFGGGDDEMQGKCRQSCCHFSTGLTAAFHGSGHLSARPFFSSFSSSPSPLFPLSVSIEGELAPCLEPSGYLFNIVSGFERSMTGAVRADRKIGTTPFA